MEHCPERCGPVVRHEWSPLPSAAGKAEGGMARQAGRTTEVSRGLKTDLGAKGPKRQE